MTHAQLIWSLSLWPSFHSVSIVPFPLVCLTCQFHSDFHVAGYGLQFSLIPVSSPCHLSTLPSMPDLKKIKFSDAARSFNHSMILTKSHQSFPCNLQLCLVSAPAREVLSSLLALYHSGLPYFKISCCHSAESCTLASVLAPINSLNWFWSHAGVCISDPLQFTINVTQWQIQLGARLTVKDVSI